jgi:hypothetical protein
MSNTIRTVETKVSLRFCSSSGLLSRVGVTGEVL